MKSYIYILFISVTVLASGCAATGEMAEKRQIERALQEKETLKVIESGTYLIRADKLFARRVSGMRLRPSHNFILVDDKMARINLAYIGRSFSTRAISGINLTGQIEKMDITPGKRGSNRITMRVRGAGELFNIYIHMSASGDCTIDINNARLDRISYRGRLADRS